METSPPLGSSVSKHPLHIAQVADTLFQDKQQLLTQQSSVLGLQKPLSEHTSQNKQSELLVQAKSGLVSLSSISLLGIGDEALELSPTIR